jgi:hypothetical protein
LVGADASSEAVATIERFSGYFDNANHTPNLVAEATTVVSPPQADLSGRVILQGRSQPDVAGTVRLIDTDGNFPNRTTNFDSATGAYTFADVLVLPAGSSYRLEAAADVYLSSTLTTSLTGGAVPLPDTILRGGDATLDLAINLFDISCVGSYYGGMPGSCGVGGSSDINLDGVVNLFDLTIVGGNYGLSGFQPW